MPSDRPSGFLIPPRPKEGLALAVPRNYRRADVLQTVRDGLAAAGRTVRVTDHVKNLFPPPSFLAVLDGWAQLTLVGAVVTFRHLLPQLPTLAIVTDGQNTAPELLDAGFRDCIVWPVPIAQLLAQCGEGLGAARRLRSASIYVDRDRLAVRCNAVHMTLTRSEFRLMVELLRAQDRWSSSSRLRAGIAVDRRAGTKPVAEHIHAIRRKLKTEAWRLRSHHSLGYFFDASQAEENMALVGKKS